MLCVGDCDVLPTSFKPAIAGLQATHMAQHASETFAALACAHRRRMFPRR